MGLRLARKELRYENLLVKFSKSRQNAKNNFAIGNIQISPVT